MINSLIAKCREYVVDPRTCLRDVLLRVGKASKVAHQLIPEDPGAYA